MDEAVFTSALFYRDPKAALRWLEKAFGFEVTMAIDGPPEAPEMCHYEMSSQGRGRIMVGAQWDEWVSSPASVGGKNTQTLHVQLPGEIDEHCERARAAGATIAAEPEDQFYGDRTYRAVDLEGHRWTFADQGQGRQQGRGRSGSRPAHRGDRLGVSDPAERLDDTLAALADPVRRRAVELLAERPHRAGELAEVLGVAAPAMSKHLRVLRQRGLVTRAAARTSTRGCASTRCVRHR